MPLLYGTVEKARLKTGRRETAMKRVECGSGSLRSTVKEGRGESKGGNRACSRHSDSTTRFCHVFTWTVRIVFRLLGYLLCRQCNVHSRVHRYLMAHPVMCPGDSGGRIFQQSCSVVSFQRVRLWGAWEMRVRTL